MGRWRLALGLGLTAHGLAWAGALFLALWPCVYRGVRVVEGGGEGIPLCRSFLAMPLPDSGRTPPEG